jgi:3-phosphoshikimate 1-carboxyvinyltransferase
MDKVIVLPATTSLTGHLTLAGDKSITHRAIFFAGINHGSTRILSPSPAADCRASLQILHALGCSVHEDIAGITINRSRDRDLTNALEMDCGNSGTTARLAAGFLTGEEGRFALTGDPSLSQRPMDRVAEPLRLLGASVSTVDGHLPMSLIADGRLRGADAVIETTSAQVHGALVLAALRSERGAVLRRTQGMRDHTLRMAEGFGAAIRSAKDGKGWVDRILPSTLERDIDIVVPGDFSSAAFFIAAALLVPGSTLTLHNVGLNPTRTAFLLAMGMMGADVEIAVSEPGVEPVGRITVRHTPDLRGVDFSEPGEVCSIAEMMDELPLLALVASRAHGRTIVRGASELRVKESDRIAATASVLGSFGVDVMQTDDGFVVEGPQSVVGSGTIDHHGDHRICMMAAVAALIANAPVTILDPSVASVSYPEFWNDLERVAGPVIMQESERVR